jgi:tRNA(Ile)-lysidine synthase TilS/MesJ
MEETKRCSRCILPETFPGIAFNEQGVCNFCSNHRTVSVLGEAKLREILHAEKGRTYDCVVPISGGKDSTYVLYYAVKILNLKVIAVNYDSGFQCDLAIANAKHTCDILNVPLVVKKADYKTHAKMLKESLLVSEIVGTFFGTCGNCGVNIRTAAINTAKEYDVPFILEGSSIYEKTGTHFFVGLKGLVMKIPIMKAPRSVLRLLFHMTKYCFYSIRQRIQMKVAIRYRFRPRCSVPFPKKIGVIHFFDYVEWDTINKVSFLEEKLGWKYPGDHEHRFDCLLHCFISHRWLQDSGISSDGFTYSTLTRENRMKREDAISKEIATKERLEKECLESIEKVGLRDYKMPRI